MRTTEKVLKDAEEMKAQFYHTSSKFDRFTQRQHDLIAELSAKLRESEELIKCTRGDYMTRVPTPPKKGKDYDRTIKAG